MNKIEIFKIQAAQKLNFGNTDKQNKQQIFASDKRNADSFEKKTDKKTVKRIATIASIAAIILGAVLFAKSGKLDKFNKTPKNIDIEKFKRKGSFENGTAKLKNKLFTGTITVNGKNGDTTTLTYDKGRITQSLKVFTKDNKSEAKGNILKEYLYKPNGRKIIIQKEFEPNGILPPDFQSVKSKTVIFPDKSNLCFANGKEKGTIFINDKPKAVEIVRNYDVFNKYGHELPMSGPYELNAIDLKTGKRLLQGDEEREVINKLIKLSDVNNNWYFYGISDSAFK